MRRARPLLGTIVEIAISDDGGASGAMTVAFDVIEKIHHLMSFHEAQSDVSAINRARPGEDIFVDYHTYKVLEFARQISDWSNGSFDVCVAAVLIKNAFLPRYDDAADKACDEDTTYRDLELLPAGRLRWHRRGQIDLGGIAKGYAVDCAIVCLRALGIRSGLVNAGGDLRCFGDPQAIHLRHPLTPGDMLRLGWLAEGAIATSASYYSSDPEKDPLVDIVQRSCIRWNGSVSVLADDCMIADALTKVVRIAPEKAIDLLEQFDAQALVLDDSGARSCGRARLTMDL
jgi:FAD:protein FMN transferase